MSLAIPQNQIPSPSFWGEYQCEIAPESHLLLPKPLAGIIGATQFILTKGLDGCLLLAPPAYFSVLQAKVQALPFTDKSSRSFRRHLFANAALTVPDSQNRISVPARLRQYANLSDRVSGRQHSGIPERANNCVRWRARKRWGTKLNTQNRSNCTARAWGRAAAAVVITLLESSAPASGRILETAVRSLLQQRWRHRARRGRGGMG
ncbi:MAG TPA: hypothetical protein G4N94_10060 [Caldilineae bacterium]|nr:hypothetical protein [Caldilineae bacterium]